MPCRGERGFSLVVVLGVLALLTVLTLGFARRALLERRTAALSADRTVAMSMARGAVQRGIADLRNRVVLENWVGKENLGRAPTWRKHKSLKDEKLYEQLDMDEKDNVDYVVETLDGRISLNAAPKELLDEIDALSFVTVEAIIERRGDRSSKKPPCPFLVPEEVLTLDGIDEKDWYGKDDHPGARDILTAWGSSRVDLNTAPAAVLESIPDLDASTVEAVTMYRQGADGVLNTADDGFFARFDDLARYADVPADQVTVLQRYCKLNSQFFTITGFATRRQGKVTASCTAVVQLQGKDVAVLQWREGPVGS